MNIENPQPDTPVLALFPFALGGSSFGAEQADLCRGISCYLDRQLSRLPGLETALRHFVVSSEDDPTKKGWMMSTELWSEEQLSNLPEDLIQGVTHLLQGKIQWDGEGPIKVSVELYNMVGGYSCGVHEIDAPEEEGVQDFFEVLGNIVANLLDSPSAGRVAARVPCKQIKSLRKFFLGLAGIQAWEAGMTNPRAAIEHLTTAIIDDHDFYLAEMILDDVLATCLQEGGEIADTAVDVLELLIDEEVDYPRYSALLGLELAYRGEYERAEKLLAKYIEFNPRGETASRVYQAMGNLHVVDQEYFADHEDLIKAINALEKATMADPVNASAWAEYGDLLSIKGDSSKARAAWKRALQEDPDNLFSLWNLGTEYYYDNLYEEAIKCFEQLVDYPEFFPKIASQLTWCYLHTSQDEKASYLATKRVEELNPSFDSWFTLYIARYLINDEPAVKLAISQLQQIDMTDREREVFSAVSMASTDPDKLKRFLSVYLSSKRDEKISALLLKKLHEDALTLPNEAAYWRLLHDIYTEIQDAESDRVALENLVGLYPNDDIIARSLIHRYNEMGLYGEALSTLLPILEEPPLRYGDFELAGDLYRKLGKRDEALQCYQRASETNSEGASVRRKILDLKLQLNGGQAAPKTSPPAVDNATPPNSPHEPRGFLQRLASFFRKS